ncbi:MAG: alanine/glycine:cation symporter family protein [Candidatus Aminicenantia bacterium]
MEQFLDSLLVFFKGLADFMWGNWMIALLVGTGIFLSFRTGFVQIKKFFYSLKLIIEGRAMKKEFSGGEGDISPFAALMTALAATVGNGNIAGVATAIATGGPGAPFWMWVAGFFGMATKYSECFLGVLFRRKSPDGSMAGGPMYYARDGIKNQNFAKILGASFAIAGAITALIGTGNMMQSNSMALAFKNQFGIPYWISGLAIAFLTGLVTIGGIKRIGLTSERLVPTMIILYFLGSSVVILANITKLPETILLIIKSAFTTKALGGALVGTTVQKAISLGVRRGVLSNEAGLGSAAIAQSASKSPDPSRNGLLGMTGVFIDTLFVNTLTTIAIVISGKWVNTEAMGVKDGLTSTALTQAAFSTVIPYGGLIVALCSFLFGYTTLLGWSYYGEKCTEYILGFKAIQYYRWAFVFLVFIGSLMQGEHINIVWYIGDSANAFMAIPNLVSLLFLNTFIKKITEEAFYKKGKDEPR